MVTTIIARHSESTWHIAGKLAGQIDEAVLTAKGKKQALAFAKKLERYQVDAIYASGLKRAIQTAEIIGKYLDKSLIRIPGLNERSWGNLEGRFDSEIKKELGKRFDFIPPQGESYRDLERRVITALVQILKQSDNKTILIVTHGGAKEALERFLRSLKWKKLNNMAIIVALDANVINRLQKSYN